MLAEQVTRGQYDAVLMTAAVSDYLPGGVFAPAEGTRFEAASGAWSENARLEERTAAKIRSDEAELWVRLIRAPKLIDSIRRDWNFRGVLVKFKLEVGVSDEELQAIAERARLASEADLMVANTLE